MATVKHVFKLQSYICICLTFGSKLRSLWRNFLYSKYLMNKYVNYRYSTHTIEYCTVYSTAVLYTVQYCSVLNIWLLAEMFHSGRLLRPRLQGRKDSVLVMNNCLHSKTNYFWDFDTFYKVGKIRCLSRKIVCIAWQIVFEIWYILQGRTDSVIVMKDCLHMAKQIIFEIWCI